MKNNNLRDDSLLNAGLSLSSQSLNETSEFNGIGEEGIPRSGSLPDMSSYGQSEDSEFWQTSRTKKVCIFSFFLQLYFEHCNNYYMQVINFR